MKFIKLVLCLIVISTCVIEIQGRNKNLVQQRTAKSQKVATKGILDKIFLTWLKSETVVSNDKGQEVRFDCEVKKIATKNTAKPEGQQLEPYGVEFNRLDESVNNNDKTGFFKNLLSYEYVSTDGVKSENKQPILDFRQVLNCQFYDNRNDLWGDWAVWFKAQAYESYSMSEVQPHGKIWDVKFVLSSAGRAEAMETINYLKDGCQIRNKKINALKDTAIQKGYLYYNAMDHMNSLQTSLENVKQLGASEEQILSNAQSQADAKEKSAQQEVIKNQAELDAAIKMLQESTKKNTGNQEQTEVYSTELDNIQLSLSKLNAQAKINQESISQIQKDLGAAVAFKNSQQKDKNKLVKDQALVEAQKAAEIADFAKIAKEQETQMNKLKAEYAAKQAALDAQLTASKAASDAKKGALDQASKEISSKKGEVEKTIVASVSTIEILQAKIQSLSDMSAALKTQVSETKDSVTEIQNKLDESRSIANQMKNQLSIQTAMREAELKELEQAKAQQKAALEAKLLKQQEHMKLLDQNNKDVQKVQKDIKDAETQVIATESAFSDALAAIVQLAARALPRTNLAFTEALIGSGQHKAQIDKVVSQSNSNVRMAQQRFAKANQAMQRLAKVQEAKIQAVRMARKKNKASRKARKAAKKARRNKRAEQ